MAGLKLRPSDARPPAGPLSVRVGAGAPKSVTVNVPGFPTLKLALLALVTARAPVARSGASLLTMGVPSPDSGS